MLQLKTKAYWIFNTIGSNHLAMHITEYKYVIYSSFDKNLLTIYTSTHILSEEKKGSHNMHELWALVKSKSWIFPKRNAYSSFYDIYFPCFRIRNLLIYPHLRFYLWSSIRNSISIAIDLIPLFFVFVLKRSIAIGI